MENQQDFYISTDKSKMDIEIIHKYLSEESYWAKGISKEIVEKSVANSFCFGVFYHDRQTGRFCEGDYRFHNDCLPGRCLYPG